ncbi:hypothetical protein CPB85DRAFT_1359363, partial [Mucidula mucida]
LNKGDEGGIALSVSSRLNSGRREDVLRGQYGFSGSTSRGGRRPRSRSAACLRSNRAACDDLGLRATKRRFRNRGVRAMTCGSTIVESSLVLAREYELEIAVKTELIRPQTDDYGYLRDPESQLVIGELTKSYASLLLPLVAMAMGLIIKMDGPQCNAVHGCGGKRVGWRSLVNQFQREKRVCSV